MKLWAISDVHIGYEKNKQALLEIQPRPGDWCAVVGDVGETPAQLEFVLDVLGQRFERLIWVPGNHELWTHPKDPCRLKGRARYTRLVQICRERDVLTPEDDYVAWPEDPTLRLCPLFVGLDYSMAPEGLGVEQAKAWALEEGILSTDERLLVPAPYPSIQAWCAARIQLTEGRLAALPPEHRTVLIAHWPLRMDLVRLPERVARFLPWCGTRRTEDWHLRFNAALGVYGHLHMRATDWRDGVRFEEVALGYPRHWSADKGIDAYVRQVWPPTSTPSPETVWHR